MANIQKDIVVDVPVEVAYDQWTQFESFPKFMDGVKEVVQLDEKTLRWTAQIGPKVEEWEAEISEQIPNKIIAWRSTTGTPNAGTVRFDPAGEGKTRVLLELSYEPRDTTEKVGDALGVLDRRVGGDLNRFREFIEKRQVPTGAWRGEIRGGKVEPGTSGSGPTGPR